MQRFGIRLTAILSTLFVAGTVHAAHHKAQAKMIDAKGETVGIVHLEQNPGGLQVRFELRGLPPGPHGFHIHQTGRCETPDFKSAGGHFNPADKKHGLWNPQGKHVGDLPNLVVLEGGMVQGGALLEGVSLTEGKEALLDKDGAAFVIHEGVDDHRSDPAGNAGGRIACGVIAPEK